MTTAVLCLILASPPGVAKAQDDSPSVLETRPDAPTAETASTDIAGQIIPKLTVVSLEIIADLSSNGSKSLETFPIRLTRPVEVEGAQLLPAGLSGMGEVVHAKKAGGSGAPGELVLAARYLEFDGRRIPLRSLRFATSGESKINDVNTLNTVAAATVPVMSFVGFFMKGGEISVPRGTLVEAKLSQDFEVAPNDLGQSEPVDHAGEPAGQDNKEGNENENHQDQ